MFEAYSWHTKLPDENLSVYEPFFQLFFETMYERMMIWKRRFIEQKPQPWTENAILRDSKFTNVYRELDRNSQWQISITMKTTNCEFSISPTTVREVENSVSNLEIFEYCGIVVVHFFYIILLYK